MPGAVRVACCQIAPDVEHADHNAELALAAIAAAVDAGAQIVVVPELVNSGYMFTSLEEAQAAAIAPDDDLLAGWAREAARGDAIVVGGFCERAPDGRLHNSSALVDGDGVRAVYRKLHLWGEEPRWFAAGDQPAPVIQTPHGRIGLGVCYDIEFPELTRGLALAGAELMALPANWPREAPPSGAADHPTKAPPSGAPDHPTKAPPSGAADHPTNPLPAGERPILHSLAATTAYLSKVYVAVCDRCGSERGLEFEGGSVIAGPDGWLRAGPVADRGVDTLIAECDLAAARQKRSGEHNDAFADRRPEHYAPALTAPYRG